MTLEWQTRCLWSPKCHEQKWQLKLLHLVWNQQWHSVLTSKGHFMSDLIGHRYLNVISSSPTGRNPVIVHRLQNITAVLLKKLCLELNFCASFFNGEYFCCAYLSTKLCAMYLWRVTNKENRRLSAHVSVKACSHLKFILASTGTTAKR